MENVSAAGTGLPFCLRVFCNPLCNIFDDHTRHVSRNRVFLRCALTLALDEKMVQVRIGDQLHIVPSCQGLFPSNEVHHRYLVVPFPLENEHRLPQWQRQRTGQTYHAFADGDLLFLELGWIDVAGALILAGWNEKQTADLALRVENDLRVELSSLELAGNENLSVVERALRM